MVLYEPTPTKRSLCQPKLSEKDCKELYQRLLEYGFKPYKSTLWEDLKKIDEEKYKDHRDWFTKLLDGIFDLLSMDIMDLFRRSNDEDY